MNDAIIGFIFGICLIIGMGLGLLFNSIEMGGAIGLGVGLLMLLIFRNQDRQRYR
ncbi:hypothetical protein [Oceanobacillus chungangensis]|uniref:hypothetical protein n=1 Tax=Oceanobacillus chungangensis TaxID=1229152 RepID=UPI0014757534|nr:hypothetical protein [Oceanobacillus chungangensis]